MQNILIIGATSAIAEATARLYAKRGDNLYLLARNMERLDDISKDLKIRGANSVNINKLDISAHHKISQSIDEVVKKLTSIDVALIAHGSLSEQQKCQVDLSLLTEEFNTNGLSTILMLSHLANIMESSKKGTIAVISSVAGDRGRQSNYVYGSAKGMLTIFLQGLRNRLNKTGVEVLTIKPGFVDTPMTADFKKGALWAKPENIATGIVKAIDKKKSVVYLPAFWRGIMLIIKTIPEFIFKKLSL